MSQTDLGIDEWRGSRGQRWAADVDRMDAMLAPVDHALIDAARFERPLRIADIGSGGGATAAAMLRAAPAGSNVFGYDISPNLVAAARSRHDEPGLSFHRIDAGNNRPEAAPFDLLVSRFGIMFFDDPGAAFQNLAGWLTPGGRVLFAVWGLPEDNPWMTAAKTVLGGFIEMDPPVADAPGPFRYGDAESLLRLLKDAGISDAAARPWSGELAVGGGLDPEGAADFWLDNMRDMSDRLRDAGTETFAEGRRALIDFYRKHQSAEFVSLPARVHIVTGTKDKQ